MGWGGPGLGSTHFGDRIEPESKDLNDICSLLWFCRV